MEKIKDKGFLSFLRKQKGLWKIGAALAVGLILLSFGSFGSKTSDNASSVSDEEKTEQRLEQICSSLAGVGDCRAFIYYTKENAKYGQSAVVKVESVVLLCEGAGSTDVKKELTEMISSLFGIGSNRITIAKLEK